MITVMMVMNFYLVSERGNMFRYFRGKKEGSEEEREGKVRDEGDVLVLAAKAIWQERERGRKPVAK